VTQRIKELPLGTPQPGQCRIDRGKALAGHSWLHPFNQLKLAITATF
jgi:hypothetical protein